MQRPVALETSPEARLAAVIANTIDDFRNGRFGGRPHDADFSDFVPALRPYVAHMILQARISEAKTCGRMDRANELEVKLASIRFE